MKVKIKDIRNMSSIEREKKLENLRKELFKVRSSNAMGGTMQDPSKIRELKRSIARILTVINEKHEK
ncbi:MAG: 50S ribosomal protein L29 [Promethearchaeota archaeon]